MYFQTTATIQKSTREKAQSDLLLSTETLNNWYPGDRTVEDGGLVKGDQPVTNEMVDRIIELTGWTATIFLGN